MCKLLLVFLLFICGAYSQATSNLTTGVTNTTIQQGVTGALPGETVVVFPGLYSAQISFANKTNIKLIAWAWITNTNNSATVINGTGLNPTFQLGKSYSNTIQGFTVTNATTGSGMFALGGLAGGEPSQYNYIINNVMNKTTSPVDIIWMNTGNCISNYIISNVMMNSGDNGLETVTGSPVGIFFYRNLVISNAVHGVFLNAGGIADIANNTFSHNLGSGVDFNGVATGRGNVINNIFLTNGNAAGEYGLDNSGSAAANNCTNGYNLYESNFAGSWTGANTVTLGTNYTNNLNSLLGADYLIPSTNSGAVDRGTNVTGVTEGYSGSSPDIGWREFIQGVQAIVRQFNRFFLDF
jgi:hypothetical protein